MSITNISSHHNYKINKNSFHFRNDSGELDVFEAAKYFSNPNHDHHQIGLNFSDKHHQSLHAQKRTARMSLDMPNIRSSSNQILPPDFHTLDQKLPKENKKYKQPSSPGGRLASFLNSLFNQTSLKKKKSKLGTKDHFDIDEISPGGRRKRRSSISHFRITTTTTNIVAGDDNKSKPLINPSTETVSNYANTPTKLSYKVVSLPDEKIGNIKTTLENEIYGDQKKCADFSWIDHQEKSRIQNLKNNMDFEFSNWKSSEFSKFSTTDDGADSDSSSDLFDLPNHELDFYSSGLPVYETTHVDRIKIVAPISRATTV